MAFRINPAELRGEILASVTVDAGHVHSVAITEKYGMAAICIMGDVNRPPAEAEWLIEPISPEMRPPEDDGLWPHELDDDILPFEGDYLD